MPSEKERSVSRDEETQLLGMGWSPEQIHYLRKRLEEVPRFSHFHDLVVSGPDCAGVPVRETAAVYRDLIESARDELIFASYAIYNGKELFQPIVARQAAVPGLRVTFYLDIPRARQDTTLDSQIVARYRKQFIDREWPGEVLPKLYHFTPALEADAVARASMHAKVIICDRKRAFVTSANLTNAAQAKNIEVGTLFEDEQPAQRLASYFEGLCRAGVFAEF